MMESFKSFLSMLCVSCSFAFVFCWVCLPAKCALADNSGSVSIDAALSTGNTIMAGDPIILHYKVLNTSGAILALQWGVNNTSWYTLQLENANGISIPPNPIQPPLFTGGAIAIPNACIAISESRPGDLVISKLFPLLEPGKYTLIMHINLPYTIVPNAMESDAAIAKMQEADGNVFSEDETMTFTVTAPDATQVAATAAALANKINEPGCLDFGTLLDALFSMPESAAYPSWQSLVNNPGTNAAQTDMYAAQIATELASVHSAGAIDLLTNLYENPKLSTEEQGFVGQQLNESYNDGSPAIREQIGAFAASHGMSLTQKIPIPMITD